MSQQTWIDYGIGINADSITTTADKLRTLIALDSDIEAQVISRVPQYSSCSLDELYESLQGFGDYSWCSPISNTLAMVMTAKEDVYFAAVTDGYENQNYVLYMPSYPWQLKENEKSFKEEKIFSIFRKYIEILTDENIKIDYQEVENWG